MKILESSPVDNEVVAGQGALLVGISINNSYFSVPRLEQILSWASVFARSVYVMIPDVPAVHTMMALGKTQQDAEKIARLKANNLQNKCEQIRESLQLPKIICVRWKNITFYHEYQTALGKVQNAYLHDQSFKDAINRATGEVLMNANRPVPSADALEIGVQFLFQELAFITRADKILVEEKVFYVYHKTMDVLKDILEDKYLFKANPGVGFITAEVG